MEKGDVRMSNIADKVPFLSTVELAHLIKSKQISCRQVLELFLARCSQLNPSVNAIVVFDIERARSRACSADVALSKGEDWGVLHGVPCTVKENNNYKGTVATQGDPAWKNRVSPRSEVAIQRLLSHGAIIFGKTNLPFHAMDLQSYNDIYGTTHNPWDDTRTPGGSSGGSCVAVACGFTPFEFGGDIGGSIRTPAAFCGVFGHKPTFNIIPKRGPFMEKHPKEISVRGPFARNADDLRLLMECLAFTDGASSRGMTMNLPRPTKKKLSEYKIAIWSDDLAAPVDDELVDAAERVALTLERLGATVSRTARPDYDFQSRNTSIYFKLTAAAATLSGEQPLKEVTLKEYRQALEEREEIRSSWERYFQEYDVLICPSHSTPAFVIDESEPKTKRTIDVRRNGNIEQMSYYQPLWWAFLTNTGLLPSTTFPCGVGQRSNLPLGLNVVSSEYNDFICIDFVRLLSKESTNYEFTAPPGYGKKDAASQGKL